MDIGRRPHGGVRVRVTAAEDVGRAQRDDPRHGHGVVGERRMPCGEFGLEPGAGAFEGSVGAAGRQGHGGRHDLSLQRNVFSAIAPRTRAKPSEYGAGDGDVAEVAAAGEGGRRRRR